MNFLRWRQALRRNILAVGLAMGPSVALALTPTLSAPGVSEDLQKRLESSSAVMSAETNGLDTPQELIAASMSDYRTLLQIMYDEGYFGPVISIRVNGREAADIPTLEPPRSVTSIAISVQSGPAFRFGRAYIGPLAPETVLPEGFKSGQPANTGILRDVVSAGIRSWREAGHAKAEIGDQKISVNARQQQLNADISLLPGPRLRFGRLKVPQDSAVNADAIARIAAFPSGEVFAPATVQRVGTRLRRTGAFSGVSMREAETPNPDGTLDFEVVVVDQTPRRISFGGELSSESGLELSARWIHRNLFGAAERFQFESRISNIGGEDDIDGSIGVRLDQPAFFGGDDNLFYVAGFGRDNQPNYSLTRAFLGAGVRRVFSENLFAEFSVVPEFNRSDDAFGKDRDFKLLPLPLRVELDQRDNRVNATKGYFLNTTVAPFLGLSDTESGLYTTIDARGYLSLTSSSSLVLAGRVQVGSVFGPSISEISPQYLYYSGGAGTVRGQPYESLGIPVGNGLAGGRSILALSTELRGKVTDKISLVGFFDIAAIDENQFVDADSPYQSGAGIGVRYDLGGLGPLRLDLALPVDGSTGDGLQFYLGIGQAF
ncbi:BamA/TamA family outer membrane protein [Sedimentitalea sp. JM2-8]|uniref:BamA/TamA family outer membrane protein n=1 Tax=Sedimentitalea xiamensis TaxID=3050037 RepID=A0ABT7FAZ9_9RHOB|nr:BamA/TamA family outer membrane protein [Sedimentitalea xiamensis]MDK3072296.1 BamA/TamA family outer membrane protein [Sedimentitalea xiamensis]